VSTKGFEYHGGETDPSAVNRWMDDVDKMIAGLQAQADDLQVQIAAKADAGFSPVPSPGIAVMVDDEGNYLVTPELGFMTASL